MKTKPARQRLRKLLCLILTLSMILGSVGFVSASTSKTAVNSFGDIKGTTYEAAVSTLYGLGILHGYADGTFQPEKKVTRAEMAMMIIDALGYKEAASRDLASIFPDLKGYQWAEGHIAYAQDLGIIKGYNDKSFKPYQTVSYNEAAAMLVGALGYTTDVLEGTWPSNYIDKAKELGILEGIKGATEGAKRGDIAVMLYQTLDKNIGTVKNGTWTEANDAADTMAVRLEYYEKTGYAMQQKYVSAIDTDFAYNLAYTLSYDKKYLSNPLGFRTAGSDAEHAAADYLAAEMKKIGLTDIEKAPVQVDKWQFNGATLKMGNGETRLITPASYATAGTDGLTAEIVDVGKGTAAEYEGIDVTGKIVLASINQLSEWWINYPMSEAELHGAKAIITYDSAGYAALNDDDVNMQDICGPIGIPCVSISKNEAKYIQEQLTKGNTKATLTVDNVVEPDKGTSYSIIGKIKGKSSAQQIIYAGHYDTYWNGFQDDCCASALVLTVAKAMIDSGYVPENDIVFVCHGAEEWGASDTPFDWATGSWRLINQIHPEWAGKTLALFNFELPALNDDAEAAVVDSVPDFYSMIKEFVNESAMYTPPVGVYPQGTSTEGSPSRTMEDGIGYRFAGVPYMVNNPGMANGWYEDRYHTVNDDAATYSEAVMSFNTRFYGSLGVFVDQSPALLLDLSSQFDSLSQALNEQIDSAAGADVATYKQALEGLKIAAENNYAKAVALNKKYEDAVTSRAAQSELDVIRAEGRQMNQKNLKAFKYAQDQFVGLVYMNIIVPHEAPQNNIELLQGVIDALKKGDLGNTEGTGALDIAWKINGMGEFYNYSFSPEVVAKNETLLFDETNPGNVFWGTGKMSELANVSAATRSLLAGGNDSFDDEIAIYEAGLKAQQISLKNLMTKETKAMKEFATML